MVKLKAVHGPSDYLQAFHTTRRVKSLLLAAAASAIIFQLAAAGAAHFSDRLDPPADAPDSSASNGVRTVALWGLPATKFGAPVAAALLTVTVALSLLISITDRLGGAGGFVRAFYLSLALTALLTPWQQVLGGTFAHGALSDAPELLEAGRRFRAQADASWLDASRLWSLLRWLGYPAAALLTALGVQWQFARGFDRLGAART